MPDKAYLMRHKPGTVATFEYLHGPGEGHFEEDWSVEKDGALEFDADDADQRARDLGPKHFAGRIINPSPRRRVTRLTITAGRRAISTSDAVAQWESRHS